MNGNKRGLAQQDIESNVFNSFMRRAASEYRKTAVAHHSSVPHIGYPNSSRNDVFADTLITRRGDEPSVPEGR